MRDYKNDFCVRTFGMPLMAAYAEYGNMVNFLWNHEQNIMKLDSEIDHLKERITKLETPKNV